MEKNILNIKTLPVSIKVVEVNNKKMTISVFNQIPEVSIDKSNIIHYSNIDKYLIGWVLRDSGREKYLLYTAKGILYKSNFFVPLSDNYFEYIESTGNYNNNQDYLKEYLFNHTNQLYIAT